MSLTVTIQQGGMRQFERTGIYPEYLLFNLPGTRQSWRVKVKEKPQKGVLRSKRKVLYEYSFNGHRCKFKKVHDNCSLSGWKVPDCMIIEMRD